MSGSLARQIIEADLEAEPAWVPLLGVGTVVAPDEKPIPPRLVEIVQILQNNLLLCEPCLLWLRQKQGEMSAAQLRVLYTEEQLEALKERLTETAQ